MIRKILASLCAALIIGAASVQITEAPAANAAKPPIRAAFYYPWFPETWGDLADPFTNYTPSRGFYSSSDPEIVAKHIADMQYAGLDAGIASWWGPGTPTDSRIKLLLDQARGTGFKWALYYEDEGFGDPGAATLASDLDYIAANYSARRQFLKIGGRPVLFVYGDAGDDCTMADRWAQANAGRFYVVLKVFGGYASCASQPDSWHQYGPASATTEHLPYSFAVSPGYWKKGEAPLLERSVSRFRTDLAAMRDSGAEFQLVTTFNEWGEGTAVEPSTDWHRRYLRAMHDVLAPAPASSFTVAVAGDICGSCKPTSDLILARDPDLVLTVGDNAYSSGSLSQYQTLYDPNWGRFKTKTMPAPGNHEWETTNAQGYRDYFGFGSGNLYRSFNAGGWHFVQMDTTKMSSTQASWISQDLAASDTVCEVGYGHHPRYSSGEHGNNTSQEGAWQAMASNGVDVALYGHDHDYERFAPINGIREFVVGTGGASHYSFGSPVAGSEYRLADVYGVLFLTLNTDSYSWQFVDTTGTVRDQGSGLCH